MKLGLAIAVILAVLIVVYRPGIFGGSSSSSASPVEVAELVKSKKSILIDVREKDEVDSGMIPGALWLPLSGIESNSSEVNRIISTLSKDQEILTYCRSGKRSEKVAVHLRSLGFKVRNAGGYSDLKSAF